MKPRIRIYFRWRSVPVFLAWNLEAWSLFENAVDHNRHVEAVYITANGARLLGLILTSERG
jgi:hypothetical protein